MGAVESSCHSIYLNVMFEIETWACSTYKEKRREREQENEEEKLLGAVRQGKWVAL